MAVYRRGTVAITAAIFRQWQIRKALPRSQLEDLPSRRRGGSYPYGVKRRFFKKQNNMAHNRKRRDGAAVAQCINLAARFGERYRITYDPAYDAKGRPHAKRDPWMMVIECQRGTIYPYGGNQLAVEVDGRPITVRKLRDLADTELIQLGDNCAAFVFDVSSFEQVATIVKPRRKRVVSAAERDRLQQLARQHGFQPRNSHQPQHSQTPLTCDPRPPRQIVPGNNA